MVPELEPLPSDGGVARRYQLPGALGSVGLISPLSRHFCGSCNRLRLTSEGALKPCLHSSQEISVRGLHGEALLETLREAIQAKPQMHGILDAQHLSQAGRTMNTIGG
jgi:cyclic pyranopterin phosphate synthase